MQLWNLIKCHGHIITVDISSKGVVCHGVMQRFLKIVAIPVAKPLQ